jgi:hypothetical protein
MASSAERTRPGWTRGAISDDDDDAEDEDEDAESDDDVEPAVVREPDE